VIAVPEIRRINDGEGVRWFSVGLGDIRVTPNVTFVAIAVPAVGIVQDRTCLPGGLPMSSDIVDHDSGGSVASRFHFTREMIAGPIYRKYEKAIRGVWNAKDLDFSQDAADWQGIDEAQRRGLLGVTVRFLAGEQAVTDELVPMLAAAHALSRYDWTMFLSTFLMEEAKHSEFFMLWHDQVVGVLEPDEVAAHFLVRSATVDPTGRFRVKDLLHEGLPQYGDRLMDAIRDGDTAGIEIAFVRFAAAYNAFAEGVLTMPSYEIVIDTTLMWDAFPALREGFRRILADEGRHITFGTAACRMLIEKHPAYEALVHEVFDEYRGNLVGLVEYQKAVPGLDLQKYQTMKVRHYRNRCREMGITPDETLIEQILDPEIDFVVGVEAG
jgi:ribonucleoside-diphosphate reductase beta chain